MRYSAACDIRSSDQVAEYLPHVCNLSLRIVNRTTDSATKINPILRPTTNIFHFKIRQYSQTLFHGPTSGLKGDVVKPFPPRRGQAFQKLCVLERYASVCTHMYTRTYGVSALSLELYSKYLRWLCVHFHHFIIVNILMIYETQFHQTKILFSIIFIHFKSFSSKILSWNRNSKPIVKFL